MSEPREQPHHEFHESLNIRERQESVERINRHNKIMHARLKQTEAIIDIEKQQEDFKRHVQLGIFMKRKSKYRGIPKVSDSPTKSDSPEPTFDALAYALALPSATNPPGFDGGEGGVLSQSPVPIQTLQDFRRSVISQKRAPNMGAPRPDNNTSPTQAKNKSDIKFEFVHDPSNK
jgi:hypothetical protein